MSLLYDLRLLDGNIRIRIITIHQVVVTDEPGRVFVHQNELAKLIRLSGLAAAMQLSVRFKQTEKFNRVS